MIDHSVLAESNQQIPFYIETLLMQFVITASL